jgi:hypothetical protein
MIHEKPGFRREALAKGNRLPEEGLNVGGNLGILKRDRLGRRGGEC